jgi:hypothetical protein
MNTLLTQVQTLEAHLQSVSEHSRNTDVVFHWLAFCPEADDGYWYLLNNPNGQGSSAIVNIVSIWSFGASESGTTKWLACHSMPSPVGGVQCITRYHVCSLDD